MRHTNKHLGVVCVEVEFNAGLQSNNLTQRSGGYREQWRTLWDPKQQLMQFREGSPNFNHLELEAEIGGEPRQGRATHQTMTEDN